MAGNNVLQFGHKWLCLHKGPVWQYEVGPEVLGEGELVEEETVEEESIKMVSVAKIDII